MSLIRFSIFGIKLTLYIENLWAIYLKETKSNPNPKPLLFHSRWSLHCRRQPASNFFFLHLIKGNYLLYNSLFYYQREYWTQSAWSPYHSGEKDSCAKRQKLRFNSSLHLAGLQRHHSPPELCSHAHANLRIPFSPSFPKILSTRS